MRNELSPIRANESCQLILAFVMQYFTLDMPHISRERKLWWYFLLQQKRVWTHFFFFVSLSILGCQFIDIFGHSSWGSNKLFLFLDPCSHNVVILIEECLFNILWFIRLVFSFFHFCSSFCFTFCRIIHYYYYSSVKFDQQPESTSHTKTNVVSLEICSFIILPVAVCSLH